ncbi:hypothetical protein JB92DRAFT_3092736 [Gautieria morchelliformis]|nr:hypothetical protein JB92DRAFT_3092736 [Gautieria morchelliformis]
MSLDLPAVTLSLPQSSISSKAPKTAQCAVIDVNPYIVPWKKVGEKWHEVAKRVQDAGYCIGRDPDTLKNKNGKVLAPQAALTHEANSHLAVFTSLSGQLDAIASIWAEAKELTDAQCVQAKKEKDADKVAGEDMHLAMMAMRKGTKRRRASQSASDGVVSDKENQPAIPTPSTGTPLEGISSVFTSASSNCRHTKPPPRASRANEAAYMRESDSRMERICLEPIRRRWRSVTETLELQRQSMTAQTAQSALLQVLARTLEDV